MPVKRAPEGVRRIPLAAINEPELPIRRTITEESLRELAGSIQAMGVLQPILVAAKGARYDIIAGHRRFLASALAAVTDIPALVLPPGGATSEAIKLHENVFREDLNTAEEAVYFDRLLETMCGGDVDELCRVLRAKRAYVEDRLILLAGDHEVFDAVANRRISFAVARELNKVSEEGYRRTFLDSAIRGGASARVVLQWRTDLGRIVDGPAPADGATAGPADTAAEPPYAATGLRCFICTGAEDVWDLQLLYIHSGCKRAILDRWLARMADGEAP